MDWWRRPHLHRPRRSFEIPWSISKAYTTKPVNMGYAKSFLPPVGIRTLLLTFQYVFLGAIRPMYILRERYILKYTVKAELTTYPEIPFPDATPRTQLGRRR